MQFAVLCAAILASTQALELYPGGALVPAETREVEAAREWLEAAQEAARVADSLNQEEALEEEDGERQIVPGWCRACLPAGFCCGLRRCRTRPICRNFPPV